MVEQRSRSGSPALPTVSPNPGTAGFQRGLPLSQPANHCDECQDQGKALGKQLNLLSLITISGESTACQEPGKREELDPA